MSAKEKEFYDVIKQRACLILESIMSDVDNSDKVQSIDNKIFKSYTPKVFAGSESVEIKYDKQFENACLLIAQKVNIDAKKMTVLQFYNAINVINAQIEAESKQFKRPKRK